MLKFGGRSFQSIRPSIPPSDSAANQALCSLLGEGEGCSPVAPSLLLPTEPHREKAREAPPFKTKQLGSFSLRFTGVDSFQQLLQIFRNYTLKSELGAHQSFTRPSLGAACWECHHLPRAASQSSRLPVSSGM